MFGFEEMWDIAEAELADEMERIPEPFSHPDTPDALKALVTLPELKKLLTWSYQILFQVRSGCSAVLEIIDDPSTHHLLWTIDDQRIRFAVPNTFPIDLLFSFEIPHTSAHLLHLETCQQQQQGVKTYWDDMEQRAFFEAVAVFSEWQILQALHERPEICHSLLDCLSKGKEIDPECFRNWMIQDRLFEARLRAARLLADICAIQGMNYEQTHAQLQSQLGIPSVNAEREIKKYYSLTGLGAIYTLGYRRLINAGITTVPEAIQDEQSRPIRTWNDFSRWVENTAEQEDSLEI